MLERFVLSESRYSDEDEEQVSGATEGNQTKILSSHERQQLEIQKTNSNNWKKSC